MRAKNRRSVSYEMFCVCENIKGIDCSPVSSRHGVPFTEPSRHALLVCMASEHILGMHDYSIYHALKQGNKEQG